MVASGEAKRPYERQLPGKDAARAAAGADSRGLLPGVRREGAPLRRAGRVVRVKARTDRPVAVADVQEAPDLLSTRQAVPPTFGTHVIGLTDHRQRAVVLAERLQRVAHQLTGFET